MECPACGKNLTRMQFGALEIDVCRDGCAGVWLDRDELIKLDERHEFPEVALLNALEKRAKDVPRKEIKKCPRCGEVMARQFIDPANQIEIDQCWTCAGIWLDTGELNQIRAQFRTFADRQKAVDAYADKVIEEHRQTTDWLSKDRQTRYHALTQTAFTGFVFALKKLLGRSDPHGM